MQNFSPSLERPPVRHLPRPPADPSKCLIFGGHNCLTFHWSPTLGFSKISVQTFNDSLTLAREDLLSTMLRQCLQLTISACKKPPWHCWQGCRVGIGEGEVAIRRAASHDGHGVHDRT